MGTRGPIAKKGKQTRAGSLRAADGQRLRRLPADADAIARRLARDIPNLTNADVALVEDTARWVAVAAGAYSQLIGGEAQPTGEQLVSQEIQMRLTVTDTAHGNKEEARKNPLLIVMRTASEQIRANAQQLGASPAARARLPEPEGDEESIADVLFGGVNQVHAGAKRQDDGRG
jgi:phage terminase small subunit